MYNANGIIIRDEDLFVLDSSYLMNSIQTGPELKAARTAGRVSAMHIDITISSLHN